MDFWQKGMLLLLAPLFGCGLGYLVAIRPPGWHPLPVTPPPHTQRLVAWSQAPEGVCAETTTGELYCLDWDWERNNWVRGRTTDLTWQPAPLEEAQPDPHCGVWETPTPPRRPARQVLRVEDCHPGETWSVTDYAWIKDGSLWVRHDHGNAYGALFQDMLLMFGGAALGFVVALIVALAVPARE